MVFYSKLPKPDRPTSDVFNFIFEEGRRDYPSDRVLYKVHETNETLTFAQLEEESRRFASVLVSRFNIKPNDGVTFFASNSIKYPVAFFGVLAAGGTISPVPVQQDIDAKAIIPRLQQSQAKLIITDNALLSISQEAANAVEGVSLISLDAASNVPDLSTLVHEGDPSWKGFRLRTQEELESHNAFIYRTSGSSGNMKSVLTPHAHWTTNLLTTKLTVPESTDPDTDVWISSLPFAYGINAKLNLGLNILLGIPVIITLKQFDQASLPLIDQYGITFLFVTPPLAAQIAKSSNQVATFNSVKWLLSAGAPVHAKIREAVQEKFNHVRLSLEWGTTETLLIALQIDEASSVTGSSGTLVNGVEAKVLDIESGEELGAHQKGELLVRNSLCRFAGYSDNEEANRDFDSDGWFHSGDVGYLDENSNVFIVDRLKELLRIGDGYGTHVSTGEIESVLFDHPAVATAVVVGIRDEDLQTEHPTGFVVLQQAYKGKANRELAEEIEGLVEKTLGTFKRLSGGVHFVDKYPQTGYKINKRLLKSFVHVGQARDLDRRYIDVENPIAPAGQQVSVGA